MASQTQHFPWTQSCYQLSQEERYINETATGNEDRESSPMNVWYPEVTGNGKPRVCRALP